MVILNKTKPNMRNCQVIKSGFHDSFQDLGRIGFRKYGIPQSGAMDFWAYQWANWLVGNELNAPTIEMTFKGGSFLFLKNACIAFTGADMNIELDGQSIPNYQSIFIKKGSTIKCNYAQKGVRTYMAIKGICNISEAFGSYSTYTYAKFGGNNGQLLKKGDAIEFNFDDKKFKNRKMPARCLPIYNNKIIRIIKSTEWNYLTSPNEYLNQNYQITNESNRMGIRLKGQKIQQIQTDEMTSSGTNIGTIQLLPSGQLIVLMNDGQTTGGYPRIANVIRADLGRLAQISPNSLVRFRVVNMAEARAIFDYKMAIFAKETSHFLNYVNKKTQNSLPSIS